MPRKTPEELKFDFIKKAGNIHRDKYGYSNIIYSNNKTKVEIYCNICKKSFWQTPNDHISGCGCKVCGYVTAKRKISSNNSKFISKAEKIHGDRYGYGLVEYTQNDVKVKIICNSCGKVFEQTPHSHLRGCGCLDCSGIKKSSTEAFCIKANIVHNNMFKYDLVDYVNCDVKVKIICDKKHIFLQSPYNHLLGQACPYCDGKYKTTEQYIEEVNKIHDNIYDYSLLIYSGSSEKITVKCKKCNNLFFPSAGNHRRGTGCPKCFDIISKDELEFLRHFNIPDTRNNRQKYIKPFKVDGYDDKTNTIYEFLGDYWHGNPSKYNSKYINQRCKKTANELYNSTFVRLNKLKGMGYNLKYIWEHDWKNFQLGVDKEPRIITI